MLDFESCQSLEKLLLDNEICGMAKRLSRGIDTSDEALAFDIIKEVGHEGKFLSHRHTLKWFNKEQFIPSSIIDRSHRREWAVDGEKSCRKRAKDRIPELLKTYRGKPINSEVEEKLDEIMLSQKGFPGELLSEK
ncbi:MAG: Trimethylamine methyltransferase (MTTB) [bacterium ADurb.Bin363]|nr:MAG: Trimethylamine methyltransferase (MTTB) [bacterium ADurb.Bin363]